MTYRTRIYYSAEQPKEIWDRWKRGEPVNEIGRAFDRFHSSAWRILNEAGGIHPAERKRSHLLHLFQDVTPVYREVMSFKA